MPITFDPSRLTAAVRREVMVSVIAATEVVRTEAVRLVLESEKTGRLYRRRTVEHRASAPGEPWATDTGYTVSQIKTHYDEATLSGYVRIDTEWGPMLELGTIKMEPRPVLRPALVNTSKQVGELIAQGLKRAIDSL